MVAAIRRFNENGIETGSQIISHSGTLYPRSFSEDGKGLIRISGSITGSLDAPAGTTVTTEKSSGRDSFVLQMSSAFSAPPPGNNPPNDISVSASTFDENIADGSVVATLSTADPDAGDTHAYAFVGGTGDVDNGFFKIDGDQVKIVDSPDYETKALYSVLVQTRIKVI